MGFIDADGVDVRPGSATFGQWFGCELSADNRRQLFMPCGFAHGFLVLSDAALLSYKCSAYYEPEAEVTIRWDDPLIGVEWPAMPQTISAKDRAGISLSDLA
jgi:dTDP-4-dehydrorhamnose 3,5-epimerase